ncbi:MAG: CBS domain-containing protein [Gammaproteobacteria bacterium]|nr:CBS domain-containing protein [Gammaproteobacteria bacterium]
MGSEDLPDPGAAGSEEKNKGPKRSGAEILARDLMVPLDKYPSVTKEDTLAFAAKALSEWHIDMAGSISMPRFALVLSDDAELVGIVRRRDILRGLAPSFLVADISDHPEKMFDVEVDPNLAEMLSDRAEEKLRKKAKALVGEVCDEITLTVQADDPLIRVVREMVRHDRAIIPVQENGVVVGVVRTVEVLGMTAELIKPESTNDQGV